MTDVSGTAAAAGTDGSLPRLTQFDFHQRLMDVPGSAVILFTRQGCGACKVMGRVLAEWQAAADAPALFVVDAETDTALVREFEVFHLPALFVFQAGAYHGRLEAPPRLPLLREALTACLARPPEEAP
ncbi:glutaredoxin [Thioalkalivibrio versutus]|uniref:Glutaredoxin n=1 Tax=Thioalkalivibrio versutus TaxID=106634 RepID=A0A0G3G0Z0_9GAMM|nr:MULTISPECIES: thioredoxin family protein [Thioalkalivibrio]AKJ94064.1 glutaredoxin [Thioalkalivibrio versutus]